MFFFVSKLLFSRFSYLISDQVIVNHNIAIVIAWSLEKIEN